MQRRHIVFSLSLTASLLLAACASATTAPPTAWGKPGVSRVDYGTEVGMCSGFAAMQNSGDNGTRTAGGISGSNSSATPNTPGASGSASANGQAAAAAAGDAQKVAKSGKVDAATTKAVTDSCNGCHNGPPAYRTKDPGTGAYMLNKP